MQTEVFVLMYHCFENTDCIWAGADFGDAKMKFAEMLGRQMEVEEIEGSYVMVVWRGGRGLKYQDLRDFENRILECGTCGGEGGVDSGGVTPWGWGIDIPCPECSEKSGGE